MSSEDFLEEVTFVLGIITRGKFLQVGVVGFGSGNRKRKVIEEMILVRCRNSISEGGKVQAFTVQRQEQPWGVWEGSAGEKVRRHARPCPNQHFMERITPHVGTIHL